MKNAAGGREQTGRVTGAASLNAWLLNIKLSTTGIKPK